MLMMRWLFWHDALALLAFGGLEGGNSGALMLMMRWLFWHLVALRRKQRGRDSHDVAFSAFRLEQEIEGPWCS